jgi:hypothetical protein
LAGSCWVSTTGDCFEIDSAILLKSLEQDALQAGVGAGGRPVSG